MNAAIVHGLSQNWEKDLSRPVTFRAVGDLSGSARINARSNMIQVSPIARLPLHACPAPGGVARNAPPSDMELDGEGEPVLPIQTRPARFRFGTAPSRTFKALINSAC